VGGGPGGYYTQADYRAIVDYARAHYVTIVPEIDGPGHTNAALASYPALNCTGTAPPLYTGTDVGFSSLCVGKDITYTFLDNVLGELAGLTPGPYLHIGGDEAQSTKAKDYTSFEGKELPLVAGYGKAPMAWHDIAAVTPPASTVLEYWGTTTSEPKTAAAVARGNKVVLAPANKAYLDMKYSRKTKLGQNWAGYIEEQTAYDWNPGSYLSGVGESAVLGVEAPLWSETLVTLADLEFMTFPRLPAIAELGWSPAATHDWTSFRSRLGAQGPRWTVLGIGFFASAQIPWAPGTRAG
ncbi:family 20 glycosylhydrolase, partial [Amycolatopsis mediterranei]